jgi:hypothetical protein
MEENSEVVETVVEPVVTTEETTPPPEETAKTGDEETKPEVKPEKTFTQKELDDILTRRLAKEQRKTERYARAEAERDILREQLSRQQAPQSSVQSGEPKPEQFKTYEEYIDKLTDWKIDQREAKREEMQARSRQEEYQQTHEATIRENLSKAADKYDDFEEVVTNPNLTITPVMTDAMGESEVGGEIAYYLGNNPKEAAAIAQMSNVQQVKAIDRLEAKFKSPNKVSEAPAPAQVTGKGKATQAIDLNSASLDDYMKIRQKQGARWANR